MARTRFAVALLAIAASGASAQTVRISHALRPDGPVRTEPVQLVVTVDATPGLSGGTLTVLAPTGLALRELRPGDAGAASTRSVAGSTLRIDLGSFRGRTAKALMISADAASLQRGKYRILLSVEAPKAQGATPDGSQASLPDTSGPVVVAQGEVDLEYVKSISAGEYLGLGLLGVLLGYGVRLLVKILGTIQAPLPAPGNQPPSGAGPITQFVQRHYYVVDCGVTLVVGLLVLAYLINDGYPPRTSAYWYAALVTGVGLGLLTNSELITKLPR